MYTTGARPVLIWLYPFYHRSLELSHYNDPLTGSVLSLPFPQTISLYFSPSPYLCILIAARSIFIQSPGLCRCSSPLLYHLLQCNHPGLYLAIASKYPPPLCRPVERASGGSSCMRGHVSDQHSRLVSFQARSAYLNNNAGVNSTSHRLPCDVFWLQQSSTTGPFIVKMQKFFLQVMPYSKMERGAVYNFLSHGCFGFLSSLPSCGSVVRDATLVSSLGTRKRWVVARWSKFVSCALSWEPDTNQSVLRLARVICIASYTSCPRQEAPQMHSLGVNL